MYIYVYIYIYYIHTSPLISLQFPMFPHCVSPHFISSLCHKIRSSCCKLRLHEGAPCAEAIPWELGEFHGSGESSYGGFILWMEEILHHQTDGWNPINNGMFMDFYHLSTGAGFLPPYGSLWFHGVKIASETAIFSWDDPPKSGLSLPWNEDPLFLDLYKRPHIQYPRWNN